MKTERKREIESLKLRNRKQETARMNDKDKENEIRYSVELSVETLKTCARGPTTAEQRERDENIVFEGKLHQLCKRNKGKER